MAKTPRSHQRCEISRLERGEIYLVSFDPTLGHEIKKTRPALIIQNDIGNRYSPVTIVAAITSTVPLVAHPVRVVIEPTNMNGLDTRSTILLDQIRTVDRQRLIKRLGEVDTDTLAKVDDALRISLALVEI